MKPFLIPAFLLVLAAPSAIWAEEPTQIDRLALEGRWSEAREALWRWFEPLPMTGPESNGYEIDLWRSRWLLGLDGRVRRVENTRWGQSRRERHLIPAEGHAFRSAPDATFPVLEALFAERMIRETRGMGDLPTGSPLASLPDPDGVVARFLAWQAEVYRPTPAEKSTDAAWAAQARADREQADSHRSQAHRAAFLAAALLLGFTLLLGVRLGRPSQA